MPSISLQDFLFSHFRGCYKPGRTVRQSKVTVSISPRPEETVYFFEIDCEEGRACLKMNEEGISISDYLISYAEESQIDEVICVLETKGSDLKHAAKQIEETEAHLRKLLNEKIPKLSYKRRICILLHGSVTDIAQGTHKKLYNMYGKENVDIKYHRDRYDIGPLLRKG